MKLTRAEKFIIVFTLVFVVFTVGVHIGKGRRHDGFAITVQDAAETPAASASAAPETADAGPVNINTASREELQTLDGIGPALAQRIIDYRSENGDFADIGDIMNVSGIGSAKFEKIRDYITVGEEAP